MPDEVSLGHLFEEYEKNSKLTVLEAGNHTLKVTSCTTKNKGLIPVYTPVSGPNAGKRVMAGGIYPGETEGGRQAFFRKLEKFGIGAAFFKQSPSLADVAKAMIGRVVEVELEVESWNDEPRNALAFKIKLVSAPDLPSIGGVPQVAAPQSPPQQAAAPQQATPAAAPQVAPAVAVADADPGF